MDIKWFLTPAEPRAHYGFFVGVAMFLGMMVLMPVWRGNSVLSVALAGVVAAVASIVVKFFMTRSSK